MLLFALPSVCIYPFIGGVFFVSGTFCNELVQYLAEYGHVPQQGLQIGGKYALKPLVDFGFKTKIFAEITVQKC